MITMQNMFCAGGVSTPLRALYNSPFQGHHVHSLLSSPAARVSPLAAGGDFGLDSPQPVRRRQVTHVAAVSLQVTFFILGARAASDEDCFAWQTLPTSLLFLPDGPPPARRQRRHGVHGMRACGFHTQDGRDRRVKILTRQC